MTEHTHTHTRMHFAIPELLSPVQYNRTSCGDRNILDLHCPLHSHMWLPAHETGYHDSEIEGFYCISFSLIDISI